MLDIIRGHRRALHKIPEVGFALEKTQKYLLDALKDFPIAISLCEPCGIIAFMDFGQKETIAFRADMDALPLTEESNCEYASTHPGKMHACGHDGHMALLLSLIERLSARKKANKNALFIFQPAEEAGNGAKNILATGAFEKYNVKEVYACHVEPSLPKGTIASRPGAFMARSCEVHVFGCGKSSHIAHAEEGIDALEMCARFYLAALDKIETKYKDEMHLFKFGRFVSGTANNILSAFTQIDGSLRAFDDDVFASMVRDIRDLALEMENRYGGKIRVEIDEGYPPVVNDAACFKRLESAAKGHAFITYKEPHMTAEDFACYLKHAPGLMFNVGLGVSTELHAKDFDFEEDALLPALDVFENLFNEA